MTSCEIDDVFGAKKDSFRQEALLHYFRMTERPASAKEPLPIHNAMKWEISSIWRPGNCPSDLACTTRFTEDTPYVPVRCHHAGWDAGNDGKYLFGELPLRISVWVAPVRLHSCAPIFSLLKPKGRLATLYFAARRAKALRPFRTPIVT